MFEAADTSRFSLESFTLFHALKPDQLSRLRERVEVARFAPGEVVIREGDAGNGMLYIVLAGEASLCKRSIDARDGTLRIFEVARRAEGDYFGEMPFLDGGPLSVTAIAKTPLTVAILDLRIRPKNSEDRRIRNAVVSEINRHMSNRLRQSLSEKVTSLQMEAEAERYRNSIAGVLVTGLCLLSVYTLTLRTIPAFENFLEVNFAASPFIIVFFAGIYFPIMKRSRLPLAFFGIRLDNWHEAVKVSVLASLAFLGAAVLLKWLLIQSVPELQGLSVISFADVKVGGMEVMLSPWYWVAVSLYLCLTPLQEFVARCGIQAPLYVFLSGSEFKRRIVSIAISNLVFSAAHAHISFAFAAAAFIPGIFFGWIFARTNSLLAASISHFLIGGAGLFLFGIEEFVARLTPTMG